MDGDILETVLNRPLKENDQKSAVLDGYHCLRVLDEDYPVLVSSPDKSVEGILFESTCEEDYNRIQFFEELDYKLTKGTVRLQSGETRTAHYYADIGRLDVSQEPWFFSQWQQQDKALMLRLTQIYMYYYGSISAEDADKLWVQERNRLMATYA